MTEEEELSSRQERSLLPSTSSGPALEPTQLLSIVSGFPKRVKQPGRESDKALPFCV
jgi:hypothetical protein